MQKHADVVNRFRINKNQVKILFVDETLIQIGGGQDYWLWIAYEPDMDLCLMVDIYIKRKRTIFVCYQFFKDYERDLAEENSYLQMVLDGI